MQLIPSLGSVVAYRPPPRLGVLAGNIGRYYNLFSAGPSLGFEKLVWLQMNYFFVQMRQILLYRFSNVCVSRPAKQERCFLVFCILKSSALEIHKHLRIHIYIKYKVCVHKYYHHIIVIRNNYLLQHKIKAQFIWKKMLLILVFPIKGSHGSGSSHSNLMTLTHKNAIVGF